MQKCSIQSQVHLANDTIKQLKVRISVMENRLKNDELPEPKRREVENELVEIKKLLDKNEEILKGLHKENSKSFVLAVLIMFLCFLCYGIYVMMYQIPK
uniref:Coiled-coil domain-containing protein 167 n=1 Tax=Culicoides sonorensis TaxID=179676 RepID=A0A336M591_CULSO